VSTEIKLPTKLASLRGPALGAFVGGTALALIVSAAAGQGLQLFFQSFLFAWVLVGGLSFGSLALLFLHHMTAGHWSFPVQRVFEASARTLKWLAIPFAIYWLGVLLGFNHNYDVWILNPEGSAVVASKGWWLNKNFWLLRSVIYLALGIGMASLFSKWSRDLEITGDALITLKFRRFAPPAFLVYVVIITLSPLDWVMSLEPEWFSTMYGPLFAISQGLTLFAVCILVLERLATEKPMSIVVSSENYHLLATFMCAFVVLWTYMSFSQFLIIWSGNLPEEIHYYLNRSTGFNQSLIIILMVGHFFIPFLVLLQRKAKYNLNVIRKVCYAMLCMRMVDVFFIVDPAFHHLEKWGDPAPVPWADIIAYSAMALGLAGFWLFFFLREMKKMSLMPKNDPRLYKAISYIDEEVFENV